MHKVLNIFFSIVFLIFFWSVYNYYSSNKNINIKEFNRNNINKIINKKVSNLPELPNNTKDVIEFNNSISDKIKIEKPRSFWNLLKSKWKKKAIIISIKGLRLTTKEKLLLSNEGPWGIILFKRNIKSFTQIQSLIKDIKKLTKNKNFPILIDEEGSTVTRLSNIINHNISANFSFIKYKFPK